MYFIGWLAQNWTTTYNCSQVEPEPGGSNEEPIDLVQQKLVQLENRMAESEKVLHTIAFIVLFVYKNDMKT